MSATTDRGEIDAELERLAADGRTIEELGEDPAEDEEGQQLLDFGDQLNLSVKGSKPTDSEIKIKAISRPIKGQLGDSAGDEETVTLLVTARLDQVALVSKRNGDGDVIAKMRRHTFTPISVFPLTAEQANLALGIPEG